MNLHHQPNPNKPAVPAVVSLVGHGEHASDCRAAIEGLPHLSAKICELWNSRDLEPFVNSVLMDSREGQRRGLPVEVAAEMMFIAKLNTQIRAMEAAPLLQVSIAEANELIAGSEGKVLGLAASNDVWEERPARREKDRGIVKPGGTAADRVATSPAAEPKAKVAQGDEGNTERYLSLFLNEAPPIPALVRIELTAQETARTAHFPNEALPAMSWDFFRCITQEIKTVGVDELVLSHLGEADKCPWLPEAIRLTKEQCRFHQVSLAVDILSTTEQQLDGAIAAGLDCLIIDLNVASKNWMTRAEARLARNPAYFTQVVSHLLQKCEENRSRMLHRCLIKVCQIGKIPAEHKFAPVVAQLAELAHAFSIEWLPDLHDLLEESTAESRSAGDCLCWTPFIEASIRANGHLIVCPHDNLGTSYVADLKNTEFTQAWHAEDFRQTRQGLLAGRLRGTLCSSCPRMTGRHLAS